MANENYKQPPDSIQNLIGNTYGRWFVCAYIERRPNAHYWLCKCACGETREVSGYTLRVGTSTNCGCEKTIHGKHDTPEYYIWRSMKQRCYYPKHKGYSYYGGRGIVVCEKWLNSFKAFFEDMGPRPSSKHSLDRVDNNGDYTPENCRWATPKQQERNKRSSHLITFRGKTLTIQGWAEETGINHKTLRTRINTLNWSYKRALTQPVQKRSINTE